MYMELDSINFLICCFNNNIVAIKTLLPLEHFSQKVDTNAITVMHGGVVRKKKPFKGRKKPFPDHESLSQYKIMQKLR